MNDLFTNPGIAAAFGVVMGAYMLYIASRIRYATKRRKELAGEIAEMKAKEARAEKIKKLDPRGIAAVVEANSAGNAWRQ